VRACLTHAHEVVGRWALRDEAMEEEVKAHCELEEVARPAVCGQRGAGRLVVHAWMRRQGARSQSQHQERQRGRTKLTRGCSDACSARQAHKRRSQPPRKPGPAASCGGTYSCASSFHASFLHA